MKRLFPLLAHVEMVHAYSLIHDDLPAMDDDDLRRGRSTCHRAFDEATAILAGDALLTLAFEVIAREVKPGVAALRCITILAEAAGPSGMLAGQMADLQAEKQTEALFQGRQDNQLTPMIYLWLWRRSTDAKLGQFSAPPSDGGRHCGARIVISRRWIIMAELLD